MPALLERGNIRRLKGDLVGARADWEHIGQLAPGSQADMAAKANIERLDLKVPAEPTKPSRAVEQEARRFPPAPLGTHRASYTF